MTDDEVKQGPIEKFRMLVDHAEATNGFVVMTAAEGKQLLADIDVLVDACSFNEA
jgi:hypothetical protein